MSVKISVSGVTQALNYLKDKSIKTKAYTKEGIAKAAIFLQGEVKQSIAGKRAEHMSVDTGRFLNSVDLSIGDDDAVIFSNLPYAKFLEWGGAKFKGRRHFNNSKDRNQAKIANIMKSEVDKV